MLHIKIVKGINASICCIAAYNSALPIQSGTCEWVRDAIVSVDSSFSHLQYAQIHSQPWGFGGEAVPVGVGASSLSVYCRVTSEVQVMKLARDIVT